MVQQKFCPECNQAHKCQEVYEQLGKAEGPSVVLKVVLAFLLPLLVFIGLLAGFEKTLGRWIDVKELRTAVSLLLAVLGTLALVLIIKMINKQLSRSR